MGANTPAFNITGKATVGAPNSGFMFCEYGSQSGSQNAFQYRLAYGSTDTGTIFGAPNSNTSCEDQDTRNVITGPYLGANSPTQQVYGKTSLTMRLCEYTTTSEAGYQYRMSLGSDDCNSANVRNVASGTFLGNSDVNINLLDTNRGYGYIEYELTASTKLGFQGTNASMSGAGFSTVTAISNKAIGVGPSDGYHVKVWGNNEYNMFLGPNELYETGWYGGYKILSPRDLDSNKYNSYAIGTGYWSVAARADGTVWTWGRNTQGQLGQGNTSDNYTPTQVSGLTQIQQVSATSLGNNYYLSYALKSDGSLYAWGDGSGGGLGNGTTPSVQSTPVQVNISNVYKVVAASRTTFAIKNVGTVWVWGANNTISLGGGNTISTPVQLTSLGSKVVDMACGQETCISLKNDGSVYTWGNAGWLGYVTTPTLVSSITDILNVTANTNGMMAVKNDGTVYAWGYNNQCMLTTAISCNNNTNSPAAIASNGRLAAINEQNTNVIYTDGTGTGAGQWQQSGVGYQPSGNTFNTYTVGDNLKGVLMFVPGGSYSNAALTYDYQNVVSLDPNTFGNNQTLWLKADGNLTKDGSNRVSSWKNETTGGFFTQSNSSKQPIYVSGQLNNKPVLRFDGVTMS